MIEKRTDVFTSEKRSQVMRAVKAKNTGPEMLVRRLAFALGYRYRLYNKALPGNPDLVFPGRKKVIFVHGCFWHQHSCPRGNRIPKANREYWQAKLLKTHRRDKENYSRLAQQGWKVLVLWECELKDIESLKGALTAFLGSRKETLCLCPL